jgi:ornithine cyclodeaminase/alanine dehydrogenase-like protein (mu-crystallin family)
MLLLVSDDLVRQSITPEECMTAVEEGFRLYARGVISSIDARLALQDGTASIYLYGAHVSGYGLGTKVLGAYQNNPGLGEPYIQATVVMLDPVTGQLEAILDGRYLTALRTAAATALASRYLCRQNSRVLGILGTGLQARTHLLCHLVVRPFARVVVWGRNPERVQAYLNEMQPLVKIPMVALPSAELVCAEADVICCTTRARTPLFSARAVRPGTHMGVAGPLRSEGSEISLDLIRSSHIFVDSREKFRKLWGPVASPPVEAELGEVIVGLYTGRPSPDAVTIFKPVGMPFEDVVSARIVLNRVRQDDSGLVVSWHK